MRLNSSFLRWLSLFFGGGSFALSLVTSSLLDCFDFLDFWNLFLQKSLDPPLQSHLRHRASNTCTCQSYLGYSTLDIDEFYVSAVCLQVGPHFFKCFLNFLSYRGHDSRTKLGSSSCNISYYLKWTFHSYGESLVRRQTRRALPRDSSNLS